MDTVATDSTQTSGTASHTAQGGGDAEILAGITVALSFSSTSPGTLGTAAAGNTLDCLGDRGSAIESQRERGHIDRASTGVIGHSQGPVTSRRLSPVVQGHEWPLTVTLIVDIVIGSLREKSGDSPSGGC